MNPFAFGVGSFANILIPARGLFAVNLSRKWRMFAGQRGYVLEPLQLVIFITGCQSLSTTSNSDFNVEVIRNESMKVRFSQITTEISGNTLHIGGNIRKDSLQPTDGHIDIAIYSSSGQLLKQATTDYVSSLNLQKLQQRGGNRFSTDIQFVPPTGSTIKIAYHENRYQKPAPPTHNCNIITSCDEGAVSDTRGINTESIERNADRQ